MSFFLKILGCILCCENERPDDRDDETSYTLLGSGSHNRAIHQSDSTSNYGSSSLVTSTRKASNPPSSPNTKDLSALLHAPYTSKPPSTSSSQSPFLSVTSPKPPAASLISSPSSAPKSTSSSKSSPLLPAVPPSSSNIFPSVSKPATPFSKPPPSSPKPPSSSASFVSTTSSSNKPSQSSKVTLSPTSSGLTDKKNKMKYELCENDPLPIYIIPKDIYLSALQHLHSQGYSNYTPPYTSKPPSTSSSQSPFLSVTSPKPPAASLISSPSSAPKSTTSSYKSSPSLPAVPPSSSNLFPSVSKPSTTFSMPPPPSSPKPPSSSASFESTTSSPKPSQSPKVTFSYKSSPLSPDVPPSSSNLFPSVSKPATPFSKPPPSSPQPPSSSASSFGPTTSSPKPSQSSKDIKDSIEKDTVPGVLKKPLSPSTYTDYFAALLYAEDHYIEKWSDFQLENVTLELQEAEIYRKFSNKKHFHESDEKKVKLVAAFEIDSVPGRRPYLLSRDFVFAKPTGRKVDPFQGIIYRVQKSTTVLVEFEEDFYSQHHPNRKYDISFSFNRVCLKRAHQAVSAASDPLFQDYLFPGYASRKEIATSASLLSSNYKLDSQQNSAVRHISSFQGPPPYLVEGPLCVISKQLSESDMVFQEAVLLSVSGMVVQEAVLKIYKGSPQSRILICAPINSTCDALMRSLNQEIPESHMFRANAAFRELEEVPDEILPSCLFKGECFSCPSLQKLRAFRVILSTLVSSFRLCNEGITAGHFSHIFLVDASSATEPETMIALSNLANEKTAVIVTGAPNNYPRWVRSDIARKKGLKVSYFERLRESKRYSSLDPAFITQLVKP
ncbi:hypothetical protein Q3G72_022293 [Acer saccharum]|nr:hypothetical protein Q3G72_022293 [Acer saccharum]